MKFKSKKFMKVTMSMLVILVCGAIASADSLNPNDASIAGNLQLWLDASVGVTTQDNSMYGSPCSTTDVTLWADQSGNSNNLSQSTITLMPELVSNAMNGQPVVRFEGTGLNSMIQEFMEGSFATPLDMNTGTFFCVMSLNVDESSTPRHSIIDFTPASADNGYRVGRSTVGVFSEHYGEVIEGEDTRMQLVDISVDYATPFLLTENYQKAGPVDQFYVNQERVAAGWNGGRDDTTLLEPISTIRLGTRMYNEAYNWFLGGDVAEIIYYDRQLTSEEQLGVEQYLTAKYALPEPPIVVEDPGPWPSDYADAIMADTPAVYYRMDETYGEVLHDVSGNGLDGKFVGTNLTYAVDNPLTLDAGNKAMGFSTDTYVEVTDFDGLLNVGTEQDFSFELLFKTEDTASIIGMFEKGDTNASIWGRLQSGLPRVLLDYGSTSDSAMGETAVNDGEWHQLVFVADRDTALQLYIDGTLVGEDTDLVGGSIDNSFAMNLGKFGTYFFNGELDEFAIFGEALTLEQIQAHYDAAFGESDKIAGDANKDGKVDGSDVTILAGNWQKGVGDGLTASWEEGDFNGDGKVDGSDVTILAGNWQYGVEAAASAVPEPSTIVLLLAAVASLMVTRRR